MSQEVKLDWNSVSDRLPPFDERVLIWNDKEPQEPPHTAHLDRITQSAKGEHFLWSTACYATHWMPLPAVPRVDFKCYEIQRPNIPQSGCEIQCDECNEVELKTS